MHRFRWNPKSSLVFVQQSHKGTRRGKEQPSTQLRRHYTDTSRATEPVTCNGIVQHVGDRETWIMTVMRSTKQEAKTQPSTASNRRKKKQPTKRRWDVREKKTDGEGRKYQHSQWPASTCRQHGFRLCSISDSPTAGMQDRFVRMIPDKDNHSDASKQKSKARTHPSRLFNCLSHTKEEPDVFVFFCRHNIYYCKEPAKHESNLAFTPISFPTVFRISLIVSNSAPPVLKPARVFKHWNIQKKWSR